MSFQFSFGACAASAVFLALAVNAQAEPAAATTPPATQGAAVAAPSLSGREIIDHVSARAAPDKVHQTIIMMLTDPSGSVRTRRATFVSRRFADATKTLIYFEEPANLKGTGFLTFDNKAADKSDDQWLYLPSMGRERRISASERGAYFLGTDFTYEDIKRQTKPSVDDFTFQAAGQETIEGKPCLLVDAVPVNDGVAKDIGYGKVRIAVDPATWMVVRTDYWDVGQTPLKTTWLLDVTQVQGFLTPGRIVAINHKTGSRTEFRFEDIDYTTDMGDDLFTEQNLRKGL